jgi:glycosyltransferase involved in cell wall biosynthesis
MLDRVYIFSIMWNEEFILPYFLRHYETFADRIFIIDDHSTDKTREIASSHHKVTILDFPYKQGLVEADFNQCFEDCYKQYARGNADWAMCVDADEFIYGDILKVLNQNYRNHPVLRATGYMMLDLNPPKKDGQIYEECFKGIRSRGFDKPIIFDPKFDLIFGDGRHSVNLSTKRDNLKLLHYKYLSRSYYKERAAKVYPRTDMTDEQRRYRLERGLHYYDKNIFSAEKVI